MRKGISRAAVVAAGFVALGVTAVPSHADVTDGNGGLLSGNQIDIPVTAPVDVSGNGVALLGTSHAASKGGAKVRKNGGGAQQTSGAGGVASGNQINAPISLPVNVCGNGAAALGHADAGCEGGAKVEDGGSGDQTTSGADGVLAGNQVNAPISIPVNACGNAAAVIGAAIAGCEGGAKVKNGGDTGSGQETSGVLGVGSGNQANVPISMPVDICGNAVGNAAAGCEGGASVRNGGHRTGEQVTDGVRGVLAGNQANAPISLPLVACGNAAAIAGQAGAFCGGGSDVRSPSGGDLHTSGTGGIGGGTQAHAPVTAPAVACGNTAALVGQASALCDGDHGGYGDHEGYGDPDGYRTTTPSTLPANARPDATALPGLGGTSPISALPATGALELPQVNGASTSTARSTTPSARSADDVIPGLDNVSPLNALPGIKAPQVVTLPAKGAQTKRTHVPASKVVTLPVQGGAAPVSALPGVGGLNVVTLPAKGARTHGPVTGASKVVTLPAAGAPSVGGVGSGVGAPNVVALPAAGARSLGGVLPGLGGVSPVSALPGVGNLSAVELPATARAKETHVPASKVVALPGAGGLDAGDLPATGARTHGLGADVPEAVELEGVEHVAAERASVPGVTWTFGVAGLLAFASGALGAVRRLGRR